MMGRSSAPSICAATDSIASRTNVRPAHEATVEIIPDDTQLIANRIAAMASLMLVRANRRAGGSTLIAAATDATNSVPARSAMPEPRADKALD
jgi:hypothetical protein